jgi:hypothetical protein
MNPTEIPAWLQAGGLLTFAASIWWEQRSMRKAIEAQNLMLAAVLGPAAVTRLVRKSGRTLTPPPIEIDRDSE